MAERKRETIQANLAKLRGLPMDELRIAAAGPGEYANDARLVINERVADAQSSAAAKQTSASWATAWAAIVLVVATLLLRLIPYLVD